MKFFRAKSKAGKFKARQKNPATRVKARVPKKQPGYKRWWPKL